MDKHEVDQSLPMSIGYVQTLIVYTQPDLISRDWQMGCCTNFKANASSIEVHAFSSN